MSAQEAAARDTDDHLLPRALAMLLCFERFLGTKITLRAFDRQSGDRESMIERLSVAEDRGEECQGLLELPQQRAVIPACSSRRKEPSRCVKSFKREIVMCSTGQPLQEARTTRSRLRTTLHPPLINVCPTIMLP